ncbi:hypothetical protein P7K49_038891, partial [Saguinus oedipus]
SADALVWVPECLVKHGFSTNVQAKCPDSLLLLSAPDEPPTTSPPEEQIDNNLLTSESAANLEPDEEA